ncbi:hypothetical protein PAMC26577_16805 [Caballeronia sordidicola]|uniref:Uncharacterized protein n=1 Tax=Caballeronia sordidicola TaxID=196367 RepID=A0A242MRZ9_CABSO|nr:hypothetical protein PAMC26577_16805 [Caballeronia sordidicola]
MSLVGFCDIEHILGAAEKFTARRLTRLGLCVGRGFTHCMSDYQGSGPFTGTVWTRDTHDTIGRSE